MPLPVLNHNHMCTEIKVSVLKVSVRDFLDGMHGWNLDHYIISSQKIF